MKKYLFTMATAAMLFASCSSDDTVVDNGANEEGLVEIKLGSGIGTSVIDSKGRAAAEAVETLENKEVGIVSVSMGETPWAENGTPVTYLLQNIAGTVAANGSIDLGSEPYYYPRLSELGYDFYGYYPRQDNLQLSNGDITTDDVPFNGSQDILWANVNSSPKPVNGYNAETMRAGATVPNLYFQHQTARLKFVVVEGVDYDESTCALTQLAVNVPNSYKLLVATQNTDNTAGTITWAEETTAQSVLLDTPTPVENGQGTLVGDIMVKPGVTEQKLSIQIGGENNAVEIMTLKLANDTDKFEAGKAYTVTITINGPKEIEITATLAPWVDGEDLGFTI